MHFKHLILISLCFLLVACSGRQGKTQTVPEGNKYATGFKIEHQDSVTLIEVYSPWDKGAVMATYTITEPIHRIATASCTHIGFIDALGQLGSVVTVCNKSLVYTRLADSVLDAGDSMSPNIETIVMANVDGVMVSTYAQGDGSSEQMKKLGLNVIYNNEWMETNPLARAEWIRFVGAFYGCEDQADSIFNEVEKKYISDKETKYEVQSTNHQSTKIMTGNNFRGTWYVPSGNTYMGNLFKDAGADYPYYDDMRSGSIPLTLESVLSEFGDADVWVGSNGRTLEELARLDEKHTWFKAYKEGRVYNWYRQTTETGGNNFWERGVVHPEEILQDLVSILHNGDSLHYANKLK